MKITVLGIGSWGSALAQVLADNEHDVVIWSREQEQVNEWNQKHTNTNYLPNVPMPENVLATADIREAATDAEMVLVVIPTKGVRSVMKRLVEVFDVLSPNPIITHATKGIEPETHLRVSEMINQELEGQDYQDVVVLSGPSHAEEVILREITTITAASKSKSTAKIVQDAFMNNYFRVYTNQDVLGVELGGALKNIIAIGAGILDGLGFGDNVKAALITRGLAEITRLGVELGADPMTFSGLSGMGDLIVTCSSEHSRNNRAGKLFAQGHNKDYIEQEIGMVVEGIMTCKAAYQLAKEHQIEMPITEGLYHLIYQDAELDTGIKNLMGRQGKAEASTIDHLLNLGE